jgi:phosphonate transport system permease protein
MLGLRRFTGQVHARCTSTKGIDRLYYWIQRILFDGFIFAYFMIVGLIAALRPSQDRLLQLGEVSKVVFLCVLIGSAIASVLAKKRIKTLGQVLFAPAHLKSDFRPSCSAFWGWQTMVALLITIVLGVIVVEVNLFELVDRNNLSNAGRLFLKVANPDWELLPLAILEIIETILIAFMATLIAIPVAFVLSFFCAKNIMGGTAFGLFLYGFLRSFFNIMRSIEPILWAIIFAIWVGFGPYAGMLALMVHSVASLAKQYSEIVECVDEGPLEGIRATGAGFLQVLWFAVVPQVILPYISFTIYRWDINVRMATILGFVGGGGIGELLLQHQRLSNWPQVGTIIVAIVVWVMDSLSAYVREAIK